MLSQSITKQCPKCGEIKPTSEFARNKQKKDGLHAWCKACKRTDQLNRSKRHPEKAKEIDRKYRENHREKVRETVRASHRANAKRQKDRAKIYYVTNPLRIKARRAVSHAIADGKLSPANTEFCFCCGTCAEMGAIMQWHHPDYSKPLELIPVCSICHRQWHVATKN